jgi:hypothetical protein
MKKLLIVVGLIVAMVGCRSSKQATSASSSIDSAAVVSTERLESLIVYRTIVAEQPTVRVEYLDSPRRLVTIQARHIAASGTLFDTNVSKTDSSLSVHAEATATATPHRTAAPVSAFLAGMGAAMALMLLYRLLKAK